MTVKKAISDQQKLIAVRESLIHDKGIFALRSIKKGEPIGYFEGYSIEHPTKYSLFLDGGDIEPTGVLRDLNHSCQPNAVFENRRLIASRDIIEREEISIDYTQNEKAIFFPFACNCGAENCRGVISSLR